jgi:hypothetical protein
MGWQDAPEKRAPGSVLVPRPEIRSPGTAGCGEVLTDVSAVIDQSSSSPKGTGVWRCAQGFHCEGSLMQGHIVVPIANVGFESKSSSSQLPRWVPSGFSVFAAASYNFKIQAEGLVVVHATTE